MYINPYRDLKTFRQIYFENSFLISVCSLNEQMLDIMAYDEYLEFRFNWKL